MQSFSVLSLSSPKRRNSPLFPTECDSGMSTPYTSAPSSPRRAFCKEVEEAPLGEVRAAIPFIWESIPGTPRKDAEGGGPVDNFLLDAVVQEHGTSSGAEEATSEENGSSSSSARMSGDSSDEFEFSARFTPVVEPLASHTLPMSTPDELFFQGQILPLRLPPRLQAVKHLMNSDSSFSDESSSGSFKGYSSLQSPGPQQAYYINPGVKLLSFCGLTKSPERGTRDPSILGTDEGYGSRPNRAEKQRSRSLSPLRMFKREDSAVFGNASDSFSLNDSSSSVSSFSSSSSVEKNADEQKDFWTLFKEEKNRRSPLSELVFTNKVNETPKLQMSKISNKEFKRDGVKVAEGLKSMPRIVESESDLKKKAMAVETDTSKEIDTPNERHISLSRTPLLLSRNAKTSARFVNSCPKFLSSFL